ncbi:MAG: bifunctional adenosylcobinamide kinase/adenosylcobinamide-phosphate guanylyltransferase [Dissulfurimicrobium sp.]|uniref:bifunctional adenosylcobinamide kinase/adenosylcobinamide-phosphate guanylyltransferase n=1 Tax=Dissulfurimicrobium sp. TaxID=2022436 RepID=UPI0040497E36
MNKHEHTLVLGGAKSGKSAYALALGESYIKKGSSPGARGLFIATAQALDEEMTARINAHRAARGPEWETIEEPINIAAAIINAPETHPVIVVDCLTLWLSNLMDLSIADIKKRVDELVDILPSARAPVIMVSNETGLGLVPETALARQFRDEAGRLHQALSEKCANVFFMMAGLALKLK